MFGLNLNGLFKYLKKKLKQKVIPEKKNDDESFSQKNYLVANTLFEYLRDIIYKTSTTPLDINKLPAEFHDLGKGLIFLQSLIVETKTFAKDLANGELNVAASQNNEIIAPLKTLQASLKHLTWQSQQVAIGDYEQKVNFMGDFSDAFNNMTQQLKQQRQIILKEKNHL
jgi:hypothetical protein